MPRSLAEQHAELIDVIRRVEASEKSEHPLERIMAIEENDEHVVITTTGLHLARRVASKLERLLHVKPKMHYAEENHVRVEWR